MKLRKKKHAEDQEACGCQLNHSINQWGIRATGVSAAELSSLGSHSQSRWSDAASCRAASHPGRELLSKSDLNLIWAPYWKAEVRARDERRVTAMTRSQEKKCPVRVTTHTHTHTGISHTHMDEWQRGERKQKKWYEEHIKGLLMIISGRRNKVSGVTHFTGTEGEGQGGHDDKVYLENNSLTGVSEFWGNRRDRKEGKTERRKKWNKCKALEAQHLRNPHQPEKKTIVRWHNSESNRRNSNSW